MMLYVWSVPLKVLACVTAEFLNCAAIGNGFLRFRLAWERWIRKIVEPGHMLFPFVSSNHSWDSVV